MSNSFPEIAIVNGARTPMGRYCGKLRDFTAQELAAIASIEAMKRSGVEPAEIDHCVMGNAQQTSSDAIYGARHVALKAGVPIEVPAITVNRLCGSGMQSVVTAAQMIQLGRIEMRAGRRYGVDVAGAARHSRHALGRGLRRGQAGRLALRGAYRQLLQHAHGRHRRTLCRAAGRHSRDAGRVRALVAKARRRGLQGGRISGRTDARCRCATSGRADGRDVHRGRPSASGDHAGEPGQAEAVVRQERQRHRRQCQRHRGWWRGGRRDAARRRREAQPQAAGTNRELGHCGSRSEAHGLRAGSGEPHRAEESRSDIVETST